MNKTESLNLDGSKNPRQTRQKDEGVNTQDAEDPGAKKKKKPNKVKLWCAKICGGKKKKDEKTEKKEKSKKRNKKLKKNSKKVRVDTILQENRSGTSTKEDVGLQIGSHLESKVSSYDKKQLKALKKAEKLRKLKDDNSPVLKKSFSYDNEYRNVDKSKKIIDHREILTRDLTKSCCFLCTENSLAIAAAIGPKPIVSDKSVDACETEKLEKSCSPIKFPVHVRTIKSSIRIKVKDMCTSYAKVDIPKPVKPKKKKKSKKFKLFGKVKQDVCPVAKRTIGCVTEESLKSSKPNEETNLKPCCKNKAV